MKAPFPYFGGKSRIAPVIWEALGDVQNYVEPFAGSLAVLLLRPHEPRIETVNDADGMVSNFWRALAADPDEVAHFADWPVSENDLHARHIWLVNHRDELTERLEGDPEFFDAKMAGWWVWGISCWIGGGWCSGTGPWQSIDGHFTKDAGMGVNRKLPHLGDAGMGVKRQLPHLGDAGMGVNRKLPHLGDAGMGVNRKLPHLGSAGMGSAWPENRGLKEYLRALAERLKNVRVCCGDWERVCSPAVTHRHGLTGVFLDPPYSDLAGRDMKLYAKDCGSVAHRAREWCIANGDNENMRIVLAGYEGEHEMPGWTKHEWCAAGGYECQSKEQSGNRKKERLWLSPHCVKSAGLFAA